MITRRRRRLTERQREVLGLIVKGLTRRRIAKELGVREDTVAFHIKALARRLPGEGRDLQRVRIHAFDLLNGETSI